MRFLPAVLVLSLALPAIAADPPEAQPPAKGGAAAYDAYPEPWRTQLLRPWERLVMLARKDLEKKQDALRQTIAMDQRPRRAKLVKEAQERLDTLLANSPPYLEPSILKAYEADTKVKSGGVLTWGDRFTRPQLDQPLTMAGLKEGAFGDPRDIDAKVFQVLDGNRMLVSVGDRRSGERNTLVMVKTATRGITDGKYIGPLHELLQPLQFAYVSGTTTYTTAVGASRTVFVIEFLVPDMPYNAEK
jgi:hypothetical protein